MCDFGVKQEDEELEHDKVCWKDQFLNPQLLLEDIKKLRYYLGLIQAIVLTYALDGKDLLCQASGSGKTGIDIFHFEPNILDQSRI